MFTMYSAALSYFNPSDARVATLQPGELQKGIARAVKMLLALDADKDGQLDANELRGVKAVATKRLVEAANDSANG